MAKSPFVKATDSRRYNIGAIKRGKNYKPENDKGAYMNPKMLSYFWQQLQNKYNELGRDLEKLRENNLTAERTSEAMDTAQAHASSREDIIRVEKLTKRRQQVKAAIDEIEFKGPESDYGFCVESGEQIGIKRLMSRPETTLTVEELSKREKLAKGHGAHRRADFLG